MAGQELMAGAAARTIMPLDKRSLRKKARSVWRYTRSLVATINPRPVIVLGKEKSGTTAIAALLTAHTGSSLTRDIQAIWGDAETRIRKGELEFRTFVRRNRGVFARDIIKEPGLTFLYPQVRAVFPAARFVIIVRDPRDNIRSVFNRLQLPGSLPEIDAHRLAQLSPGWRAVLEGDSEGFRRASYVEVAAARWNTAADVYLEHRDEMVLVRYEDFVREKVATITRLADSLHLPHVRDISDQVDVQYQRRGDRTVSWTDFFGCRNLAAIERICEPRMREFGYDCVLAAQRETGCSHG